MAKFPTYEEMAQEVAQRALDEYEYEGKTLREWIEIIIAQHGTNLAEVSTDCISRQQAINALDECYCGGEDSCGEPWVYKENAVEAIQMIEPIPSAEPKRIIGHWIPVTNGRGGHECDQCHEYASSYESGNEYLSRFCPNCGADMREVTT